MQHEDLAKSPVGAASPVLANVGTFAPNEPVSFKVRLDPQTLNFAPVGYNVSRVLLFRTDPTSLTPDLVAEAAPTSPGQTEFDLAITPTRGGSVSEFYAFVETKTFPLELIALEIGQARAANAVKQLAGGMGPHNCVLLESGSVKCWGRNVFGELGDGTTDDSPVPVPVSGLFSAVDVSAGISHSCAVHSNGSVLCWGAFPGAGAPGAPARTPTVVPNITNAVQVSSGGGFSCALLASGSVACWGDNSYGQVGISTPPYEDFTVPVLVPNITTAVEVRAGGYHACARLASGLVQCWGYSGDGARGVHASVASSVAAARQSSCVIAQAGGTPATPSMPATGPMTCTGFGAQTFSDGSAWSVAAPGQRHSCGVRQGSVACRGENDVGQLGTGAGPTRNSFANVPGLTNVISASAGDAHACALTADRAVWCWGYNVNGQLGDGTMTDSPTPVSVKL